MRKVTSLVTIPTWTERTMPAHLIERWVLPGWQRHLISIGLIEAWLLVLLGLPAYLDIQIASWLTFIALLIMPGYFLADLITWRMGLDWIERLALAFPLGITVLAAPGILALLLHWTIVELTTGWIAVAAIMLIAWVLHGLRARVPARLANDPNLVRPEPWSVDQIIMLLVLIGTFIFILPTLSFSKIDGDAYAVNSFAADALAGLPLNATEPLFGTELGPGVRMVFNQSLPLSYLWAHLASIDPNALISSASRPMLALWIILAAYTLGKAAGDGSRRLGLLTASIQLLIYVAAPFMRGDNVSLFFFERTNADKFMVPTTMLPVVFAFAIRFVRTGRRDAWLAAAGATLAVSAIHPLIAAMQALALSAFGGMHLLFGLRHRAAWKRTLALGGLVVLVMVLPFIQLFMARGEAPLAPSYPSSFEGWPLGQKLAPVLPFVKVRSLDLHGPLPDLNRLESSQANTTTNPFLIWRFAVNMNRQRLIMFDLDRYISDPNLLMEPPYLLALLLLPILFWYLRTSIGAQFAVGTTLAVLFVMFNPVLTPLIGSLVMPWILWRFVWLLPYALIIAWAVDRLLKQGETMFVPRGARARQFRIKPGLGAYLPLGFILIAGSLLAPYAARNIRDLNTRLASPVFYPVPRRIMAYLNEATAREGPAMVLADQLLSVTIPAYVARANVVAHRVPTTSEVFPADRQDVALQRLIDQHSFFNNSYLTTDALEVLQRYNVRYVITTGGSNLDMQLRLGPAWFEWLGDDKSYSMYAVKHEPEVTASIRGNTALAQRQWAVAEQLFKIALEQNPNDMVAAMGLVEIARAQGQFELALNRLQQLAARIELPVLHYRLGQLYAEQGQLERSMAEFELAQRSAPEISRYHVALGDACLSAGEAACAAEQYQAAAAAEDLPDDASRLIAQADLWRQRSRLNQAVALYERAVALNPSEYNQFVLEGAYREIGWFDQAEALVRELWREHPYSIEVVSTLAEVEAAQNNSGEAVKLYRHAIWLQELRAQEANGTHLALAQLLLTANRLEEAQREIHYALALQPYDAVAYRLQGDVYRQQQQLDQAIEAYRLAFQLDPTQIAAYTALSDLLRQRQGQPDVALELLQTAIHTNPNESILFLALGDRWQRNGDTQAAIEAYQTALDRLDVAEFYSRPRRQFTGQSRAIIYARLARSYEDLGQLRPAMNYYRAAAVAAPNAPWTQILLGDALRRRSEARAAEAAYRQAIRIAPDYVAAYVRLGDLLYAQGEVTEGSNLYERALQVAVAEIDRTQQDVETYQVQPRRPVPTLESGETLATTVDYLPDRSPLDPSIIIRRTLEAGENLNAIRVLARLYQMNGQADRAVEYYKQEIQQGKAEGWFPTTLAQYYSGLGDLYLSQEQLRQAVAAYQQAVSLDGWWPEARLGLAEALSEQGDTTNALRHLQIAVEIAPGSVEAQVGLANGLDRWGDRDKALELYQAAAQKYPGQAQATLAFARAWQDRTRWARAEEVYRNTIALNPGMVDAYVGLAELFIDQARYDEAEVLLQQGLSIDRQYTNTYLRLGQLDERRGDPAAALEWYRRAATNPFAGQLPSVTLIDSLTRYGDYETTLTYLQKALASQPGNNELLLRFARIQRTLGQYVEAASLLSEAILVDSANSRLVAELAELYRAQGRLQDAAAQYQQAISRQPDEAGYYLALSQILAALGRFDQAFAVLTQGQTEASQPSDLYTTMANLYLQQGKPELALETLEQGAVAVGENEELLVSMGTYYMLRGDFEQVEQRFTQALELRPDAAAVHTALADLEVRRGDSEAALEHYAQAIALEPTNPRHYLALANAYRLAGRLDDAISLYTKAISATPTLVDAYVSLAALYQEQERWDEAQATYERGLVVAPTSEQLLTQYSNFLYERGDDVGALALLDQVVRAAPTATTLIARASLNSRSDRPADAEQDLNNALQREPGSLEALIALGDLYRDQEDVERAEQMYQAAVTLLPGVPTAYLRLGDLANTRGDRAAAQQYAKTAHDLEPGSLIRPGTTQ